MVPGMELRHLRYFVAVAEEGNITRAAARLHLSQPPLSRQIRDLEEELGVTLLERGSRRVELTAAGRVWLREARAVLARMDAAVRLTREAAAGQEGEVRIGYAPSPASEILPVALRAFRRLAPRVTPVLRDLSPEEMMQGLRTGNLDLAITVQPSARMLRGCEFEALRSYRVGAILPETHPLARRRAISIEDLAGQPLLGYARKDYPDYHEWMGRWFRGSAVEWRLTGEFDGWNSLVAAVQGGQGISIVAENIRSVTGKCVRFVPLAPPPPPLIVGLLRPRTPAPPLVRLFVEAVREART